MRIILASASPRRREILKSVGIDFEVITSEVDENIEEMMPYDYVKELSKLKARAVSLKLKNEKDLRDTIIIGADTVVYHNGRILTKPADKEDAYRMISELSGNTHQVYTGVTLIKGDETVSFSVKTDVNVYALSEETIRAYINTSEPYDKAGGYGIQGLFGAYIKGIEGDYLNVVGLPVSRVVYELNKFGYKIDYERLD
jgi:septum formation protein